MDFRCTAGFRADGRWHGVDEAIVHAQYAGTKQPSEGIA
jgi:hypothetical protein